MASVVSDETISRIMVDTNGCIHINRKATTDDILHLNIESVEKYFQTEQLDENLEQANFCYTIDTSALKNEVCLQADETIVANSEEPNTSDLIIQEGFTYQVADTAEGRYIIFTEEDESNLLNPQILLKTEDFGTNYYTEIINDFAAVKEEALQQIKVETTNTEPDFIYDVSVQHEQEPEKSSLTVAAKSPFSAVCTCCSQLYTSEASFNRHIRSIGTLDKPYQCQICEKHFSQQSNLWKHIRTHTGERPYVCCECGKAFTQCANLMKHKIIHTGKKPYVCGVCGNAFTQEANMKKHYRLHTGVKPYICEFCNKRFSQRSNLVKHRYLHQGIRPFSCDICYQSFTQQSNLKKHALTHTDVRNYFCDYCNKGYIQKISVQKHMEKCRGRPKMSEETFH